MSAALFRSRWAAIGAAVAVSIGGGGLAITQAAVSTGDRSVFVAITPCRLFDTRPAPDTVGPRTSPLGPGEIYTVQATGVQGNCTTTTVPAGASAVSMNVTVVGGTSSGFLAVYPADAASPPLSSNLNWVVGSPPTPNKVDVKLSPAGQINFYNKFGAVHVLADIVGYYIDHNHDDRYVPLTALGPRGLIGQALVAGSGPSISWQRLSNGLTASVTRASAGVYQVRFPGFFSGSTFDQIVQVSGNGGFIPIPFTLCDSVSLSGSGSDLFVQVDCRSMTSASPALIDGSFFITVTA